MISTGFPLNSGNKTEVIDLENGNVKCKDLEDFPIENSQAVYANLASMPIICGGWFWINAALQYPVRYAQLLKTDSPKRWVTSVYTIHTASMSIWMTKRQAISTDAFQSC